MIDIFNILLNNRFFHAGNLPQSVSRRYVTYAALAGVVMGVLQFGEIIARKSLGASGLFITLMVMAMPVTSITSIWWARLLVGRDQRKFVLLFGSLAYLVLMSGLLLHTIEHLLTMYILFFLVNALIIPSENRIFQQHVPAKRTGRLFGMANGLRTATAALISAFAGWYMDIFEGGYRHLYFGVALVGFIALIHFASIPTGQIKGADTIPFNRRLLLEPLQKVIELLKRRGDFFRFEMAFMLYGIAFMMSLPAIPLYLVDDLQLSYSTIGLARGMTSQLVMIPVIPLLGRIFDRTTPHRLASVIFLMLSIFPLLLLSAGQFVGTMRMVMIYITFGYFGMVMSGVMILWSLSSLRFAGKEDAGVYHSVHVAATGIRGIFAPLLGYLIMSTMGKTTVLLASSVLWVLSSIFVVLMRYWDVRKGEFRSLRAQ